MDGFFYANMQMKGKIWKMGIVRSVIPAADELLFSVSPVIAIGSDDDSAFRCPVRILGEIQIISSRQGKPDAYMRINHRRPFPHNVKRYNDRVSQEPFFDSTTVLVNCHSG